MVLEIYRDSWGNSCPVLVVHNRYGWFAFDCTSRSWAVATVFNPENLDPGEWLSLLVLSGVSKEQAADICVKDTGNWHTTDEVLGEDTQELPNE